MQLEKPIDEGSASHSQRGKRKNTNKSVQKPSKQAKTKHTKEKQTKEREVIEQPTQLSSLRTSTQDRVDRRELRKNYRNLIQNVIDNKHELVLPATESGMTKLEEAMEAGDKLFKQVKNPREAALDSEFLALTATLALEQTKRMPTHFDNYDPSEFVDRCRSMMEKKLIPNENNNNNENTEIILDWKILGEKAREYINSTPCLNFMYGPLDIIIKPRKEIKRVPKEKAAEKEKPVQVENVEEEGDGLETSKQVERVHSHLEDACKEFDEEKKDLPFYGFILDPNSFTHTIENLFHLSFLIRDGHVKLSTNNENLKLEIAEPPTEVDYQRGKAIRAQAVVKIDYDSWQKMKLTFHDIKKPLVPPNEEIQSQVQKTLTSTPKKNKKTNKK